MARRRLLERLSDARGRHHERHRPSGFGFALADSIDYVDPVQWDALTAGASLFLQRRYLAVLERAGPENLEPRYALIYRGRAPVAAVVMQLVTVAGTRFMKPGAEGPPGAPGAAGAAGAPGAQGAMRTARTLPAARTSVAPAGRIGTRIASQHRVRGEPPAECLTNPARTLYFCLDVSQFPGCLQQRENAR